MTTAQQKSIATIIHNYWTNPSPAGDPIVKPAFPSFVANGVCGSEMGEYGLTWPPGEGDNRHAHGIGQWHADREEDILKATGINIRTASILDQQRAMWWEIKTKLRGCLHALQVAKDEGDVVDALVDRFEFTGNRASDKVKRRGYAQIWKDFFNG